MPDEAYIRHHLAGAWALLRGDADGFDHFDLTTQGFYRSFWALPLTFICILPIFLSDHQMSLFYAAETPDFDFAVPVGPYVAAEIIVGLVGWGVFLIMMAPFARHFGADAQYGRFVIANNWAQLLITLISLPVAAVGLLGMFPWDAILFLKLILTLIFIAYGWFIALSALKLSRLDAAAVVALETLIVLILSYPERAYFTLFAPVAS